MSDGPTPARLRAFFGHHKCASTWVHLMLEQVAAFLRLRYHLAHDPGALPGGTVASARAELGFDLISYVNADRRRLGEIDLRGVHLVRDPRDLLVSAYFSHLGSHLSGGWAELEEIRRLLRASSVEVGLMLEIDFLSEVMDDLRSWPREVPGILTLAFESVVPEPRRAFDEILHHLGLRNAVPDAEFERILAQFAFENLTHGRRRGQEDLNHHYRMGLAGDWRNHFTPAVAWSFQRRYGDLLERYGYETHDRWVAEIFGREPAS